MIEELQRLAAVRKKFHEAGQFEKIRLAVTAVDASYALVLEFATRLRRHEERISILEKISQPAKE